MTVLASQPTTVAQDIDPSKVGAGGSGQSTDEQCEALANEINSLNNDAQSNLSGNDLSGFDLAVAESALASRRPSGQRQLPGHRLIRLGDKSRPVR